MRHQEFPGTFDPAYASGIIKNLIFRIYLAQNDTNHLPTPMISTRRRRAKCGLIPSFSGSGRNSF